MHYTPEQAASLVKFGRFNEPAGAPESHNVQLHRAWKGAQVRLNDFQKRIASVDQDLTLSDHGKALRRAEIAKDARAQLSKHRSEVIDPRRSEIQRMRAAAKTAPVDILGELRVQELRRFILSQDPSKILFIGQKAATNGDRVALQAILGSHEAMRPEGIVSGVWNQWQAALDNLDSTPAIVEMSQHLDIADNAFSVADSEMASFEGEAMSEHDQMIARFQQPTH